MKDFFMKYIYVNGSVNKYCLIFYYSKHTENKRFINIFFVFLAKMNYKYSELVKLCLT